MTYLMLYDGVCGLCNRTNQFILAHDRADQFRFASLQGSLARRVLARHGRRADALDTFYVVVDEGTPSEQLWSKGRGALKVLQLIGGAWAWTKVLGLLPTALLDAGYDFIARHRYRWFGKYDSCPLPAPEHRRKFLDAQEQGT